MRLAAIYQCNEKIVISVETKQKSGFVMSTMNLLSISKYAEIDQIQVVLNEALDLSSTEDFKEKYTSFKFNKKLAQLCECSSYKEVVSKSSIVKVVHNREQVTLIPMQRAQSFVGFEGYNNCVETFPESSLVNGELVKRVLELLNEVIASYSISS